MTDTIKVRNISGNDLQVGPPFGPFVDVPANHQHEFPSDTARSLLEQSDVWERVSDKKPEAKDKE